MGLVYNFFDIGQTGLGVYNFNVFSHQLSVNKSFVFAILGLLAGALIMELLAFVGKLLVGTRAFGEGDSFILGALGAVFGLKSVPIILIAGCVVQIVIILPLFLKKLWDKREFGLIVGLIAFALSVGLFKAFEIFNLLDNLWFFAGAFLLMTGLAFYTCKKLIVSTKKGENMTYVPFGPPLVIAAIALMFFA